MKVRKGGTYQYHAAAWDLFDPKALVAEGQLVTVVHPRGCPAPNVMGHAHVADVDGKFLGLVCTASLTKPGTVTA